MTKFIYSFLIGISLLLIPQLAYADEVLIELTPDIAYVDTVVEVNGPTEYFIETTTGPRFEQAPDGAVVERVEWVDSWIQLRQGEIVLRADDDSNHSQNNYWASKITGILDTGSYTIRATSFDYIVAGQRPIGTYTLNSNLINLPVVEPEPEPIPEPAPEPVAPPIFIDYQPAPEVAPEPPTVVEEPPAVVEEPPVEAEEPPIEVEEPPTPVEEPPAEAEEPPVEPEVTQADEVDLETLVPETPVQLDNGVVLEAGTVVALQLLENPVQLISKIFTNPAQVFTALSNIGADMSDDERDESEKVIVASVIAGQAAIGAASMAANTAPRTPSTPSAPAGGPAAGSDKPKSVRRRKP